MAQTIQIKRNNSNAATVPSSLLTGELAVNLLDRALYSSDGTDVVKLYTGTDKWFTSAGVANVAAKVSNKLTFGSKTYDGSAAKTITASDLGALTSHQSIYALTINNSAGTAQVTYTPNSKAASLTLTKAMVGLGNVENTALSTWAGSTKITTVGTITSGTWNGTKIANGYLANSSVTIAGTSVSLGGSITAATLKSNLGLGSFAYISSLAFASLTDKPTTLSGYGITDAYTATSIDSKLSGYLPLSGGTISGNYGALSIKRTLNLPSLIKFENTGGTLGYLGFESANTPVVYKSDMSAYYTLIHSGNYSSYALPLSGGTISSSEIAPLLLSSTHSSGHSILQFSSGDTYMGAIGFMGIDLPYFRSTGGAFNTLIHSGNIGSQSVNYASSAGNANALNGISSKNYAYYSPGDGYLGFNLNDYTLSPHGQGDGYIEYYDNGAYYNSVWGWVKAIKGFKGNADTATKLQTARTIWGQSFDGSANVSGELSGATAIMSNSTDGYFVGNRNNGLGVTTGGLLLYSYGATPMSFYTNTTERMHITAGGNVGIGTTSPSYKLHVAGVIYTSSNLLAAGDVTSGSDERYKEVISYAEIDINTIANAPIINFKWTDREDARVHLGSTAQYWYGTSLSNGVIPTTDDKLWTMGYGQIALASVVSVAKKVVNHEEEIKNLKKKVNELENELEQYRRA